MKNKKRCCTIGTLLKLSQVSEADLNELKKEILTNKKYKSIENLWEKCPADNFLEFCNKTRYRLELAKRRLTDTNGYTLLLANHNFII